jgi:hypothetical protein
MAGRIPDEVNFPALFLPYKTVRHAPISVCDMLRFMHVRDSTILASSKIYAERQP